MAKTGSTRIPRGGQFLSVGYEGRALDDFVRLLEEHRVEVLVDVRENAISRKPGFSKRRLSEALDDAGIDYQHQPRLGNPKENRAAFRNGHLSTGKRRFLAHLNNGSRDAFDAVVEMAMTKRVALLCFERDHDHCHRACIVEQAQAEFPALSVSRL
jgi:uncharacterized protein (DUF488 family)